MGPHGLCSRAAFRLLINPSPNLGTHLPNLVVGVDPELGMELISHVRELLVIGKIDLPFEVKGVDHGYAAIPPLAIGGNLAAVNEPLLLTVAPATCCALQP